MHKNLIPMASRTTEEQRRIQSNAGKASGEARRKKKAISEALKTLSEMKVKDVKQLSPKLTDMITEQYGENIMEQTIAQVMGIRLMEKFFMLGDVQAFKEFTDRAEGKAEQTIQHKEDPEKYDITKDKDLIKSIETKVITDYKKKAE